MSDVNDINRREFLRAAAWTAAGCTAGGLAGGTASAAADDRPAGPGGGGDEVSILCDADDPIAAAAPVKWAAEQLRDALVKAGVRAALHGHLSQVPAGGTVVATAGGASPHLRGVLPSVPEATGLVPGKVGDRPVLFAAGHDARGVVYALAELADRVEHASDARSARAALDVQKPIVEQPANAIRSVMRLFTSDVEDKGWYNDRDFWRRYLTMLVRHRFNRFNLAFGIGYDFARNVRDAYFYFAYPFLLAVPGFNVRATNLPDAERDNNLRMLRFISDEAAARGLHFQLGVWTHAYQWTDSPGVNHTIEGLTQETHAAYCREAVKTLLQACASIAGVTFRIHGESGVAEGSYDFWKSVFSGVADCGRRVEIDMHAKGMDQPTMDTALATGLPVNVSPKYWAEHMGLSYHQAWIRPTELPRPGRQDQGFFSKSSGSRSFLRYGYGDLLREDRKYGVLHRVWPGTQRLLLWADPALAAGYGRASSFCGSIGIELMEPLSFKGRKGSGKVGGRNAYADTSLQPADDWEKYADGYRVWGRLLYNPDADPDVWRRGYRRRYGPAAEAAEAALSHASRILPLVTTAHLPSAANNNYWPEVYTNMPIVDPNRPHPYGDTPAPRRFGTVSPLDPQLFSRIDDFAEELVSGRRSGKYSPAEVARWLEDLSDAAARHLAEAETAVTDKNAPAFRRLAIDVAIQQGLGRFFAAKFRAGVLYALHDRTKDPAMLQKATELYRATRQTWAELADRGRGVYVNEITFGLDKHLRGHWLDRLAAIDQDIADMQKLAQRPAAGPVTRPVSPDAVAAVLKPPSRPDVRVEHKPPVEFRPGEAVAIAITLPDPGQRAGGVSIDLYYRRVNQAESYRHEPMREEGGGYRAVIPAEYTNSPYPLQYYFELHDGPGRAWIYPGFDATLTSQPYFVVRQSGATGGFPKDPNG